LIVAFVRADLHSLDAWEAAGNAMDG